MLCIHQRSGVVCTLRLSIGWQHSRCQLSSGYNYWTYCVKNILYPGRSVDICNTCVLGNGVLFGTWSSYICNVVLQWYLLRVALLHFTLSNHMLCIVCCDRQFLVCNSSSFAQWKSLLHLADWSDIIPRCAWGYLQLLHFNLDFEYSIHCSVSEVVWSSSSFSNMHFCQHSWRLH